MKFLFNVSFDLALLALIVFVAWMIFNFRHPRRVRKWLLGVIFLSIISLLFSGYGMIKLSKQNSNLPTQNQAEISALRQKIKAQHSSQSEHSTTTKPAAHKTSSARSTIRVDNAQTSRQVRAAVKKHAQKVDLIARVKASRNGKLLVRGVHSGQMYKVTHVYKHFKANQFVVISGKATRIKNTNVIIKATSVHLQNQ